MNTFNIKIAEINDIIVNLQLSEQSMNEIIEELQELEVFTNEDYTEAVFKMLMCLTNQSQTAFKYSMLLLKLNLLDTIPIYYNFSDSIVFIYEGIYGTKQKISQLDNKLKGKFHIYKNKELLITFQNTPGLDSVIYFNYDKVLEALKSKDIYTTIREYILVRNDKYIFEKRIELSDILLEDDVDRFSYLFNNCLPGTKNAVVNYLFETADYNATKCFKFIWIQQDEATLRSICDLEYNSIARPILLHRNYELLHLIEPYYINSHMSDIILLAVEAFNDDVFQIYYTSYVTENKVLHRDAHGNIISNAVNIAILNEICRNTISRVYNYSALNFIETYED